ncbi:hypothetical protein NZL82_01520 [Sphingomonas sanguinis]|uniref:hypothetical protein n=1 Tax=Sphingomonas sp. LC-1 TaxID=3110957 RepID=UPI0021BA56F3|nr:hypothetical protein [Sphingomonas sp. LC-1]MCT8000550.1 hypothetical protein [Sphingomonas sp. LC-1]
MKPSVQPVVAYLSTLAAIVVLTITAAVVCVLVPAESLTKVEVALGFVGAAVTGLIGVIGTFRPKASGPSEVSAAPPGEGE